MNSGRRTSARHRARAAARCTSRRCLQSTLPAATDRAELAQHGADSDPVGEARGCDGGGKADRKLVHARDAAPRDDEAVADDERRKDETPKRGPMAKPHG